MQRVEFLYLSQEDVAHSGLTMGRVISIVEEVFRQHGLKRVENPPKPGVHPRPNAFIHAMPGYVPQMKAAGLKWVSSFPSNLGRDLPSVMGLIVLNDEETGQPLAIMDCRWITAARTGAASAVSAKFLAREDATVVGIVGTGIQGRYNLLALCDALPEVETVMAYDLDAGALESFQRRMEDLLDVRVEMCASPQEAIEAADVIVTSTGRLEEPIFHAAWVQAGALVLPVHHRGWQNEMLQQADKFVTDDWRQLEQAHREIGGFDGPLPALHAELGEIVVGIKPGRQNARERIVDINYGLAVEDVAVASEVLSIAMEMRLGTRLTLLDQDLPFV